MSGKTQSGSAPLVWDLPTRLFHWGFVAAVAIAWMSGEKKMLSVHQWAGGIALTLVLFRLMWGLVGGHYARFTTFLTGPGPVLHHLTDLLRPGRLSPEAGHNPMGGWMVIVLLGLIATQATLGLFTDDDIVFVGPLGPLVSYDLRLRLTAIHEIAGKLILLAILLHVGAILFYKLIKKRNLVPAMVTGRDAELDAAHLPPEPARQGSPALALILFAVAGAIVAIAMLVAPKWLG